MAQVTDAAWIRSLAQELPHASVPKSREREERREGERERERKLKKEKKKEFPSWLSG